MELIDRLEKRVKEAVLAVDRLREENERLRADNAMIREQARDALLVRRENERYRRDRDRLRARLIRLQRRIDKQLNAATVFATVGGGHDEELA